MNALVIPRDHGFLYSKNMKKNFLRLSLDHFIKHNPIISEELKPLL